IAVRLPAGRRGSARRRRRCGAPARRLPLGRRVAAYRGRDGRAQRGMTALERIAEIAARARADEADLSLLLEALGADTKAEQRGPAETVAVLARAGVAVDSLLARALADAAPRRRWGAVYAWSRLGPVPPACVPVLLDALGTADGDLRWAAATIIRALGD